MVFTIIVHSAGSGLAGVEGGLAGASDAHGGTRKPSLDISGCDLNKKEGR